MGKKTVTKLEDLSWDLVSGVDHPAHRTEGWMVLKSAGFDLDERIEEVLKAEDLPPAVREAATTLQSYIEAGEVAKSDEEAEPVLKSEESENEKEWYAKRDFTTEQRSNLAGQGKAIPIRSGGKITGGRFPIENGQDLENAMRAVGRADAGDRPAIRAHIARRAAALGLTSRLSDNYQGTAKSSEESGKEGTVPDTENKETEVEKAATVPTDNIDGDENSANEKANRAKQAKQKPATEQQSSVGKSEESRPAETEKVEKAEKPASGEIPAEVRKELDGYRERVEKAEHRAEEAERVAKAERDLRVDAEYKDKVRTFKHLTVNADELGPKLRKMADESPEMAAEVERILTSANAQVSEHSIFTEVGKSAVDANSDAWSKIQAAASERVAKGTSKSEAEGISTFLATPEGKELYAAYRAEKEVRR